MRNPVSNKALASALSATLVLMLGDGAGRGPPHHFFSLWDSLGPRKLL